MFNAATKETKMNNAWNFAGAVSVQTQAHNQLLKAIEEKRTFGIYIGQARVTTCASMGAAKLYVGKSKRYTIIAD